MPVAIITGSAGLVGAEAVRFFHAKGYTVVGVDNDMRKYFFGADASTDWSRRNLEESVPGYRHFTADIRDSLAVARIFKEFSSDVHIVVHAAGQPSHEWATRDPTTDFQVNAAGTLVMLEQTRTHAPDACFIFTSTNKVYGDAVNFLPFVELETRWELATSHPFHERGVDENFSIDQTTHSLFGASKTAADLLVQEYGRYFGMKTACFRGGCITGPGHSGAVLHGFLAYLAKCCVAGEPYTIYGYKGKQVRDNIHAYDLVNMFWHYSQNPRPGAVYNAGGGRRSNCSILEAAAVCEELVGKKLQTRYCDEARIGDHQWWISDVSRFRADYPAWDYTYDLRRILQDVCRGVAARSSARKSS